MSCLLRKVKYNRVSIFSPRSSWTAGRPRRRRQRHDTRSGRPGTVRVPIRLPLLSRLSPPGEPHGRGPARSSSHRTPGTPRYAWNRGPPVRPTSVRLAEPSIRPRLVDALLVRCGRRVARIAGADGTVRGVGPSGHDAVRRPVRPRTGVVGRFNPNAVDPLRAGRDSAALARRPPTIGDPNGSTGGRCGFLSLAGMGFAGSLNCAFWVLNRIARASPRRRSVERGRTVLPPHLELADLPRQPPPRAHSPSSDGGPNRGPRRSSTTRLRDRRRPPFCYRSR